ncbi:MAG: TetR/AcrR family transcriptional regulator [Sciscionella sp.]
MRAAIALLAERGYPATTFDAICQTAGLSSKRLITYHFATKDELFGAVAEHVVAQAEAFIRPAVDAATSNRDRLVTVIRTNVAFIASHRAQVRALHQIIVNDARIWARHHRNSIDRLTNLFADGQRSGALRPGNARVMAMVLRASIDSTYQALEDGIDPDTCAEQLVELFDHGTRPVKPATTTPSGRRRRTPP